VRDRERIAPSFSKATAVPAPPHEGGNDAQEPGCEPKIEFGSFSNLIDGDAVRRKSPRDYSFVHAGDKLIKANPQFVTWRRGGLVIRCLAEIPVV